MLDARTIGATETTNSLERADKGRLLQQMKIVKTAVFFIAILPMLAPAAEHQINAVGYRSPYELMFFEPDFLRVEPGDSVRIVVTDDDHQPQSVFIPEGAEHWQAEQGQSTTVTFTQEGIYIFDCVYHNVMGMAGVVLVGRPVNLEAAKAFFDDYRNRTFALNKDRLDNVWTGLERD
ncbi:MAG: plastocyanin/azurin family copper-binding protein [Xanthomonadales bacterium]|nr:plastocyanin/azurin family copper-binding protein [Xanthomonadales bacterium]